MIDTNIRFGDPHHYYHIRARDAAQLERIKAYIRQRIAAHDADLVRAPPIEGAKISTKRRASRPNSAAPSTRIGRSAAPPAPTPSDIKRYGSLAWEGTKRGLVDTVQFVAEAPRVLSGQH